MPAEGRHASDLSVLLERPVDYAFLTAAEWRSSAGGERSPGLKRRYSVVEDEEGMLTLLVGRVHPL